MNVHPVADLFPMLADDELAELAADIAARGLLQPIVLDTEGQILDGRNRLAACALAEVEPTFVTYDGSDSAGYALAVNIARRHLTKGQQAMVAARALSISDTGQKDIAKSVGVAQSRISNARVVLEYAPDLADSVVSGALALDSAYDQARKNKQGRDNRETQMARLRSEAADLAVLVVEEIIAQGLADDVVDDFVPERGHLARLPCGTGPVDGLLEAEDKKRTGGSNGGQLDLFSGEDASLEHVLALGGGDRIKTRHATLGDLYANLGLRADNAARVNQAFARAQSEVAKLTPYLTDPTVTVEAALAAWRRDQP